MARDWSEAEVEATVRSYLDMLTRELRGETYSKADARRRLMAELDGRSEGAVERKHQNISAILIELGFPCIDGYKPLRHYQARLASATADLLEHSKALLAAADALLQRPAQRPEIGDLLARLEDRPEPLPGPWPEDALDRPAITRHWTCFEQEALNRSLGQAGEEFALHFEQERLRRAGEPRLAREVEWVARTQGDGLGYDLRSFEVTGQDRLIEVKTTAFGKRSPFFVTRNELEVSERRSECWSLYRVFDFHRRPRLYQAPGSLRGQFQLEASQYRASLS
jgi:hypothetical protein